MNASVSKSLVFALLLAAANSAGCGDDSDGAPSGAGARAGNGSGAKGGSKADGGKNAGGTSNEPDAGEPSASLGGGGAATAGPEPVFALSTQVLGGGMDSQSYVLLTNDLDAGAELSIDRAVLEIPGRALMVGPDSGGVLFVASDQGPNVTRYELNDQGRLDKGKSVSFLNTGVTKFGEYSTQFQYISAEKAYWFDGPTAQIVVWDPTAMKVLGTVPLTSLAAEGQLLSFTTAPVRDGDTLYLFAAWRQSLIVTPRVAVVAVDTTTDEVTIVEDDRCGYVRDGVLAEDGYLYMATEAFASAAHWLDPSSPAPCLLRYDVAEQKFDANFHVELQELVDGDAAGSLIEGPNKEVFLRVLYGQSTPPDVTNPRVVASSSAWGWASLTLGDEPVAKSIDAPLSSGSVLRFALGDRVFAPLFANGTDTTFLELKGDGPAPDAVSLPGLTFSALKLR